MDEKLAKGHLFRVTMTVALPCEATASEAEEWLICEASQSGSMSRDNPLNGHCIELWRDDMDVEDIGRVGTRIEYDHKPTENGGMTYKVKYEERPA